MSPETGVRSTLVRRPEGRTSSCLRSLLQLPGSPPCPGGVPRPSLRTRWSETTSKTPSGHRRTGVLKGGIGERNSWSETWSQGCAHFTLEVLLNCSRLDLTPPGGVRGSDTKGCGPRSPIVRESQAGTGVLPGCLPTLRWTSSDQDGTCRNRFRLSPRDPSPWSVSRSSRDGSDGVTVRVHQWVLRET